MPLSIENSVSMESIDDEALLLPRRASNTPRSESNSRSGVGPSRVKHHGIHRSPHLRGTESSNEKDLRPLRWQTSLSTFPCRRDRFQVFVIYMEMSTTSTRTAGAESVSAIFIFVSAIFDFVSAKFQNGSAKFVSSAWKSRYGGDSSSDPYFMGARRHDFDACA